MEEINNIRIAVAGEHYRQNIKDKCMKKIRYCKKCKQIIEKNTTTNNLGLCNECYNSLVQNVIEDWCYSDIENIKELSLKYNMTPQNIRYILKKNNVKKIFTLTSEEGEVWVKYKDKFVSNYGRICSKINTPTKEGWVLNKQNKRDDGYLVVRINKHTELVHRVIVKAFYDKNLNKNTRWEAHHIDRNKENNRLDNLEVIWDRKSHAEKYSLDMSAAFGKKIIGINRNSGEYILYDNATKLSQEYPQFNQSAIQKCCRGLVRQHKGFEWFYINSDDLENKPPSSKHYDRKVQPLDIINEFDLSFNMGSALKYIARSKFKHQEVSDIDKAIYYLEKEKEMVLKAKG